jgi:hypothetical protein
MTAKSHEHAKKEDMQKKKKEREKREMEVCFTHMMPENLHCEFWQDHI